MGPGTCLGTGQSPSSLKKDGLLDHMNKAHVKYLNIVNLSDLAMNYCDPVRVGQLAAASKPELHVQLAPFDSESELKPTIMLRGGRPHFVGRLRSTDPYELRDFIAEAPGNLHRIQYSMPALNCYLPVTMLENCLALDTPTRSKLFKFTIKLRPGAKTAEGGATDDLFGFEMNFFNILQLVDRVKYFCTEAKQVTLLLTAHHPRPQKPRVFFQPAERPSAQFLQPGGFLEPQSRE